MPILIQDNYKKQETVLSGLYQLRNNPWWQPDGIMRENVIAAYQFKSAASETESLFNLVNRNALELSKNNGGIVWSWTNGFFIPGIHLAGLVNTSLSTFSCAVFRYSDLDINFNGAAVLTGTANGYRIFAKAGYSAGTNRYYFKAHGFIKGTNTIDLTARGSFVENGVGVLGFNRTSEKFYKNGVGLSETFTKDSSDANSSAGNIAIGQGGPHTLTYTSYYVQAAAFYNIELNQIQHAELALAMGQI